MRDVKLDIKKHAKRGTNDEAKHGIDMVAKQEAKLGIKKDVARGANDEAKHGVDMVEK